MTMMATIRIPAHASAPRSSSWRPVASHPTAGEPKDGEVLDPSVLDEQLTARLRSTPRD